jgi:hypothetical protein
MKIKLVKRMVLVWFELETLASNLETSRLDQLSWLAHVFKKRSEWILDRRHSLMAQITRQASSSSF